MRANARSLLFVLCVGTLRVLRFLRTYPKTPRRLAAYATKQGFRIGSKPVWLIIQGRCGMRAKMWYPTALGVVLLCLAAANTASAQIDITQDPSDLEDNAYRLKIDSTRFGAPHTVGIFGRPADAEVRIRFDGGRRGPDIYTINRLTGGMRIICVWDTTGEIVFYDMVLVDRSGTLRIPVAAMRQEAAGEARRGGLSIE